MTDTDDEPVEGSTGIWFGKEDADLLVEFDEYFQTRPGDYSRSERIKNAMRLYLQVQRTLEEFDYELDERAVRMMVAEGMRLKDRQDRETFD